jgi:hypothetical protein
MVDDGREVCGHPVGANRCRLRPHDVGRHDVAPDNLWTRLTVDVPVPERLLRETRVDAIARLAAMPICPATERMCSCRPGERCSPAVNRAV